MFYLKTILVGTQKIRHLDAAVNTRICIFWGHYNREICCCQIVACEAYLSILLDRLILYM